MTNFFNKLKITCFQQICGGPFSQILVLFFSFFFWENQALSHTTSYGFLAPCRNLKKLGIKENGQTDGRTEGMMEGRTESTVKDLSSYQKSNKIYKTSPKNNRNTLIFENLKMLHNNLNQVIDTFKRMH